MRVLALETSAATGSVAYYEGDATGGGRIDTVALDREGGHARMLAPGIEELLSRAEVTPGDLDLIVVGLGPGGYTGVRLGLATAKSLSFVLKVPILGVPSFEAMAAHPSVPDGRILVVLDARKGDIYGGHYRKKRDGNSLEELTPPFLSKATDLPVGLDDGVFVVGDGLPVLEDTAGTSLSGDASIVARAEELLLIGIRRFAGGERGGERALLPLYLRPSEAEIRWEKRRESGSSRQEA